MYLKVNMILDLKIVVFMTRSAILISTLAGALLIQFMVLTSMPQFV
jgi:hypothetical protein